MRQLHLAFCAPIHVGFVVLNVIVIIFSAFPTPGFNTDRIDGLFTTTENPIGTGSASHLDTRLLVSFGCSSKPLQQYRPQRCSTPAIHRLSTTPAHSPALFCLELRFDYVQRLSWPPSTGTPTPAVPTHFQRDQRRSPTGHRQLGHPVDTFSLFPSRSHGNQCHPEAVSANIDNAGTAQLAGDSRRDPAYRGWSGDSSRRQRVSGMLLSRSDGAIVRARQLPKESATNEMQFLLGDPHNFILAY